jgi:hypothetical protein
MITRFKSGVTIAPSSAGTHLLAAIDRVAHNSPYDLTVTSGSDSHPPTDVHSMGRAFDLRTHDFTDDAAKTEMMRAVLAELSDEVPETLTIPGIFLALATDQYFIQLEHHGEDAEHVHLQIRSGATWP